MTGLSLPRSWQSQAVWALSFPSIPFIMYGMASGASVSSLFLAGVIPGLMIGLLLMLYAIYHCRRYGEDREKSTLKSICCAKRAVPGAARKLFALLSPVIILGCIYSGIASPTGSGYLRFLCPVCQPVPLPDHEIPGYPADFLWKRSAHSHRSSLFWQLPRHFPES